MFFFKAQHRAPDLGLWRHHHEHPEDMDESILGYAGIVYEHVLGENKFTFVEKCKKPPVCDHPDQGTQQAHPHADQGRSQGQAQDRQERSRGRIRGHRGWSL